MADFDFDSLLKNVVDTGEKVAREAINEGKRLQEIISYNTAIVSEKRKVDSMYKELGRKYYEQFKDDPNADYAETINNITESLNVIEDYEAKVESIKAERNKPAENDDDEDTVVETFEEAEDETVEGETAEEEADKAEEKGSGENIEEQ